MPRQHRKEPSVSDVDLDNDLTLLMIGSIKAKSSKKDDVVLSVTDPRSGVVRKSVGFSIKSELGRKPSLFNTGRASAAEFELPGMTPAFMAHINSIFTSKNSVAVIDRCKAMLAAGVKMKYRGFAEAPKAKARTFYENLLLINPLLPEVLAWILLGLYTERFPSRDVKTIVQELVAKNPLGISRPEVRYPYMIKQFLYAAYCGMTAGQFWDGQSEVNGGGHLREFQRRSAGLLRVGIRQLQGTSFPKLSFRATLNGRGPRQFRIGDL